MAEMWLLPQKVVGLNLTNLTGNYSPVLPLLLAMFKKSALSLVPEYQSVVAVV